MQMPSNAHLSHSPNNKIKITLARKALCWW